MTVDALASMRHYADHLRPVFDALPDGVRGMFYGKAANPPTAVPRRWPIDRMVMVASYVDYVAASPRPVVYVEHGSGQSYHGDSLSADAAGYSGGHHMDRVELFVCPNLAVANRWAHRYPGTPSVVVGCPKLDVLHRVSRNEKSVTDNADPPVVAVTYHWPCPLVPETMGAWPHYDDDLPAFLAAARSKGVRVIGHGHPRIWAHLKRRWLQLGVDIEPDLSVVLTEADVLVADNTSAMWEFASLGKPIVVMDAPWYRPHVDHGLRFWEHADAGFRVSNPKRLFESVEASFTDPPDMVSRRDKAVSEVYAYRDGLASQRAATAIVQRMEWLMAEGYKRGEGRAVRRTVERESDLDTMTRRFAKLGASPSELMMMRQNWDNLDDDWTVQRRAALVRSSDSVLLEQLKSIREDYPWEPSHSVESLETNPDSVVMGADNFGQSQTNVIVVAPPMPSIDASVADLLEWVDGNPDKARMVIEAETSAAALDNTDPRRTLIGPLTKIAG